MGRHRGLGLQFPIEAPAPSAIRLADVDDGPVPQREAEAREPNAPALLRPAPHDVDALDESDLILPMADASIDEVRELLTDEGLIPG